MVHHQEELPREVGVVDAPALPARLGEPERTLPRHVFVGQDPVQRPTPGRRLPLCASMSVSLPRGTRPRVVSDRSAGRGFAGRER